MAVQRIRTVWILSHLVALGAGAWWSVASAPSGEADLEEVTKSPNERPAQRYRVSSQQILGAFEFDSPFFPKSQPDSDLRDERSPEEKAADVDDFEAEMQSQVEIFNQTGFTDYRFTQELIYRWMALNPNEAMDFFAKVEIRSGWGDPWPALFKNSCAMSGLELATHIDQHWVYYNRQKGLEALAGSMGKNDPTQLSAILDLLGDKENSSGAFLSGALNSAQYSDFSVWLELALSFEESKQEDVMLKLASKVVPSSVPPTWFNPEASSYGRDHPSHQELQAVLEESRGTAIEPLIQSRLDGLLARFEKDKELKAKQSAHSGKADGMEQRSPDQIRHALSSSLERSRTLDLQAVVRGEQSVTTALRNQVSLIEDKIAEGQRKASYQRLLTETMLIDPGATFQFGEERFSKNELSEAFDQTKDTNIYSVLARSKMLNQLFETPHWEQVPNRVNYLGDLIEEYRKHHVDQAADWVRSLPQTVVEEVGNSLNPRAPILKYIGEVRSK